MNARHVNFPVHDLAAEIRFYSAIFASAPAVLKPDCVKWTLNAPRVSFTIFTSDASRCAMSQKVKVRVSGFLHMQKTQESSALKNNCKPGSRDGKTRVDFPAAC